MEADGTARLDARDDLYDVADRFCVGLFYNDALTGPQYLNGNDWIGDMLGGAAYTQGLGAYTYCNSLYHVSQDANVANAINPVATSASQNCDGLPGNDDWFTILEITEEDFTCANPPSGGGAATKNSADLNLANGGTLVLSDGYRWSSEMGLIRKFTEKPLIIASPEAKFGFSAWINRFLAMISYSLPKRANTRAAMGVNRTSSISNPSSDERF